MKYRRLQTLIRKTVDMSVKCGISLNLLVKDKKYNKLVEYYSDVGQSSLRLDQVLERVGNNDQKKSSCDNY